MSTITRPTQIRAGFFAAVDDPVSGLHHAGEQWAAPRYLIDAHTHPVWEFYLQVHGVTRWLAGTEVITLRPGHLLGVAAGVVHHMSERAGGNHHFYFAAVDVGVALERRPSLAAAWQQMASVLHRVDGQSLAEPFQQLAREVTTTPRFGTEGLSVAVDLLVLQITRLLLPERPASLLRGHPAVMRVKQLLERDYDEGWTLARLSDEVGLAPTYLAGLFSAEVGCAPHTYLLRRRVERAGQLLESSDLSVTAIAFEVGFGSSQHFARTFRKITGSTPSAHRKAGPRVRGTGL